jgi:DNA-binding GntR family transcriptional regulator
VSRGTIRRALDIVRDKRLVVIIAGRGTFIRPQQRHRTALRWARPWNTLESRRYPIDLGSGP